MKIISNFSDYYDHAVHPSYAADSPVYKRFTTEVTIDHNDRSNDLRIEDHIFHEAMLYFCGKYYPCIYQQVGYKEYEFYYSLDDIDKFALNHMPSSKYKKYIDSYDDNQINNSSRYAFAFALGIDKKQRWSSNKESDISRREKVILQGNLENEPIALYWITSQFIEMNPRLNKYNFNMVLQPFQAYQEIERFLSNRAEPPNPTVLVKDKDLVTAKGYDRWSFRKMPKDK